MPPCPAACSPISWGRTAAGQYVVAQRTSARSGQEVLAEAVRQAAEDNRWLLGFFGFSGSFVKGSSHLPFQTADGRHDPVAGANAAEAYTDADVAEKSHASRHDRGSEGAAAWEAAPKMLFAAMAAGYILHLS